MNRRLMTLCAVCLGTFGFVTTAHAGFHPPSDCNTSELQCGGNNLYEVSIRCAGPDDLFAGATTLGTDEFEVQFDSQYSYSGFFVCEVDGYLDSPKTEVKCTSALNGPHKGGKKGYDSNDVTVEIEVVLAEEGGCNLNFE